MNAHHLFSRSTSLAFFGVGVLLTCSVGADVTWRYVVKDNPGAVAPYTNWIEAAATIQEAINACQPGDTVVVSNGVYDTGGTMTTEQTAPTNRVFIDRAITVRSASDNPADTIIKGAHDPDDSRGIGPAAVRCVYMVSGASLIGFTVTNGATLSNVNAVSTPSFQGGGIYCKSTDAAISNCVITSNCGISGAVYNGTLRNCIITGNGISRGIKGVASYTLIYSILHDCTVSHNYAWNGGGGGICTFYRCNISSNHAGTAGGGAKDSTLNDCVIIGNDSPEGGGVYACIVSNSVFSSNSSRAGGGANKSTLVNCQVVSNVASMAGDTYGGGGVYESTLYSCLLAENTATPSRGGGAYGGTLYNCTVVDNSAGVAGGGVFGSTLQNVISWGNNLADDFTTKGNATYSCGESYTNGVGNLDADPRFKNTAALDFRLRADSPCINQGINQSWMSAAYDLDGVARILNGQVDLGAYEYLVTGTVLQVE